jgi:hypothetical protein
MVMMMTTTFPPSCASFSFWFSHQALHTLLSSLFRLMATFFFNTKFAVFEHKFNIPSQSLVCEES